MGKVPVLAKNSEKCLDNGQSWVYNVPISGNGFGFCSSDLPFLFFMLFSGQATLDPFHLL